MEDICIYVHNSHIYKLGEQHILDILPNTKQSTLYTHIEAIGAQYNIDMAIIGFHQPLRNTIYSLFPCVDIIIHPQYVIQMIEKQIGCTDCEAYLDWEIAVGLEEGIGLKKSELLSEIMYTSKTKKEAIERYIEWQIQAPLNIKWYHHIIRTIDFYYDEVFNYFDFKDIVDISYSIEPQKRTQ